MEGEDDLRALPPLVAEKPADALQNKHQKVPLLTGVTSAETSRAVFGMELLVGYAAPVGSLVITN